MAVLAVIILTVCLSISALKAGAHVAILLDPLNPMFPFRFRRFLDRSVVFLAWSAWACVIVMSIYPPDRPSGPSSGGSWSHETWWGQLLFSLVFAPAGCLVRFYLSLKLNAVAPAFPLGTFAANILGTAVLGMAYDLQRLPLTKAENKIGGGRIGCLVLQGVMDGFCGCLTTVSTWIAELNGLRRSHAYTYGASSVVSSLALLIVIMGTVKWTVGWRTPVCVV
jgi:fluoride ion exporter CrcB/FEX